MMKTMMNTKYSSRNIQWSCTAWGGQKKLHQTIKVMKWSWVALSWDSSAWQRRRHLPPRHWRDLCPGAICPAPDPGAVGVTGGSGDSSGQNGLGVGAAVDGERRNDLILIFSMRSIWTAAVECGLVVLHRKKNRTGMTFSTLLFPLPPKV